MSIFDGDGDKFNNPFPTMGGRVCREALTSQMNPGKSCKRSVEK